jgi:putative transposase
MDKNNLIHARTCVYNVNYHIVWSVKYRKPVLTEDIQVFLKDQFIKIGNEKGFSIAAMEIMPDHVHVFASAHPQVAPSYIVKMLKGISARRTLMQFPYLTQQLWKGHLWNSSFYIETIGSISEDAIKKYIERQKTRG